MLVPSSSSTILTLTMLPIRVNSFVPLLFSLPMAAYHGAPLSTICGTLNNVETMINVPQIVLNGAPWYAAMGNENSKGTKLFTLIGNIVNVSMVELELGTSMRDLVYT